jgi:hypothetical protein
MTDSGRWASLAAAALALCAAPLAQADTVWDESVNDDLSSDGLFPTGLTLFVGSNVLHGMTGNSGNGVDRDYFSFTLSPGTALTALTLLPDTNVSGGASFLAIQAGPQVTVTPEGGGADALLAFSHYGNDRIGQNLLLLLGQPAGLPSGTYSFWVQETGGPATYGLDFQVSAVPVPAAAWLLASAVAGLTALRNRRRRTLSSH